MGSGAVAAWCRTCSGHSASCSSERSPRRPGKSGALNELQPAAFLQKAPPVPVWKQRGHERKGLQSSLQLARAQVEGSGFQQGFLLMVLAQRQRSRVGFC